MTGIAFCYGFKGIGIKPGTVVYMQAGQASNRLIWPKAALSTALNPDKCSLVKFLRIIQELQNCAKSTFPIRLQPESAERGQVGQLRNHIERILIQAFIVMQHRLA